jgi:hypothetical protein
MGGKYSMHGGDEKGNKISGWETSRKCHLLVIEGSILLQEYDDVTV